MIALITKILHCNTYSELDVEAKDLESVQVDKNDPVYACGQVFRRTMIKFGAQEDAADMASKIFLVLSSSDNEFSNDSPLEMVGN